MFESEYPTAEYNRRQGKVKLQNQATDPLPLRQLPKSIYLRLPVRPAVRIEEIVKPLHGRRSALLRAPVIDRLRFATDQAPVDTACMIPFENRQGCVFF